jgi:hypothetical protein
MFKRLTNIGIACLFLPFMLAATHPYFLSITKIVHNSETQALEITMKLDVENLEETLEEKLGASLYLGEKKEVEDADQHIEAYLLRTFRPIVNGEEVVPHYLGKEVKLDVIWLYLEIENVPQLNQFQLTNTLLLESGEPQTNIVRVKAKGEEKGEIMSSGKIRASWKF